MVKATAAFNTTVQYTDPHHIKHPKKGYWQCGVWVASVHDATVYPSYDEAEKVILIRNLLGVAAVPVF